MGEYAVIQASTLDTAERVRLALSGLLPDIGDLQSRSGLFDGGGAVTLNSGMAVNVSAFRAWIQGVSGDTQGGYFAVLDADKILTFADGSGSNRTDLVVARIYDDPYDTSGDTELRVEIFQGTPGGGTPSTPANSIKLAEKIITAGMSAGTGGLGTVPVDKRPPRLVTQGGLIPVLDATDRATLATYPGLQVYRLDTNLVEIYDGSSWEPVANTKRPAAMIYQNAASEQTITTGTSTDINLDEVDFDTDGIADIANDQLVIVTPGVYRVRGAVSWDAGTTGYRQTNILINGSTRWVGKQNATIERSLGISAGDLVFLDAGDEVSLQGRHTQGTSLDTYPNLPGLVFLSVELVSTV